MLLNLCFFLYLPIVFGICVEYNYPIFRLSNLNDFTIESSSVTIENNELVLTMNYNEQLGFGDAVTLAHNQFFRFGTISAVIRLEHVPGAVSSFITMSKKTGTTSVRDEIDWEWVSNKNEVQSNYFLTDKPVFGINGKRHRVNDYTNKHNYTFIWKKDQIIWIIDNNIVRQNDNPQLPSLDSHVRMGIWDAARSNAPGTTKWAGGPINWSIRKSVKMIVSSMSIKCPGNVNNNGDINNDSNRNVNNNGNSNTNDDFIFTMVTMVIISMVI